jgi:glycosyltransferase involved in cell wall biosynthesis
MTNITPPLLSIVIATKNRQKYAISAIESILSLNDNRIEVVIQDNSDTDELNSALSKYSTDKRLCYRYVSKPLSFIGNFNAALELSKGEYICVIGDDDGINPEIIDAALWAKQNNIDALVGSVSANYRWSGTGAPDTLFTKMTGSTLTLAHFNGKIVNQPIESSLIAFMKNGGTNYLDFSLPKLYHGIVSRECLETIKSKTGAYLKGLSPDIYASIALSCVVKNVIMVDYPLTIPGVCAESGSITEGQIKKHSKKLENAPHFKNRGDYTWSLEVPGIYCVQTIWADSSFAALREMERVDLIEMFNKYKLYAQIIFADTALAKEVINHMILGNEKNKLQSVFDYFHLLYALFVIYFKNFIVKRSLGRLLIVLHIRRLDIINNISDINMAMITLEKYLNINKFNINEILIRKKE